MQALAFPFDLHVLSTPPAFILSQDQTLHKKRFRKKQAVKSPIPNQKQTNQHPNRRRTGKNPKITRFNNRPQPDGVIKQGRSKNIRETCSTTPHAHYEPKDDAIHHWNSTTPPPAHTQTQGTHHTVHKKRQANTPTQQKYIGTLSSSQTTPAHPPTRTKHGPSRKKRLRQKLHNQPTKSQTHVKPRLTRT